MRALSSMLSSQNEYASSLEPISCRVHPRARPFERRREVRRQLGLEAQPRAGERVSEAEPGAVQELAGEAVAAGVAIAWITRQGMADRREVGADLVRAAGLQPRLDEGVPGQALDHPEMGARLSGGPTAHRPPRGAPEVAPEGGVDRPRARARLALDQRQVAALHLAPLDLGREAAVRLVPSGDDHQSRGVLVEPVDDPRALRVAAAPEELSKHVDERRAAVPRGGVHDQAGRLLDHGQPLVGVDDPRGGPHARSRSAPPCDSAPSEARRSHTAPSVIATSARLNAGQNGGSMKSVTASARTRSARLPSAPPASRPTASHSPGLAGSSANHRRTRASAAIVTARTTP